MATVDPMAQQPPMQPSPPQQPPQAAPQQPVEGGDDETFETILAGLTEFMAGKGRAGIEQQLKATKELGVEIGKITYTLIAEALRQQKDAGQAPDMEMMLGVATEVIDWLIEIARSLKLQVGNEDDLREESLFATIQTYLVSAKPSPEEQQAAQQLLMQLKDEGHVDNAAQIVSEIGQRHGVDPFAQKQPQQNQMAQGIRAGLMGAQ